MPKVTTLPSTRKIPACKVHLNTDEGRREYATYARRLFDAGRFDGHAHMQLSLYASAWDEIARRAAAGEPQRGAVYAQADKAFKALKLDDIDSPVAQPENLKANRFAVFGFACRRR